MELLQALLADVSAVGVELFLKDGNLLARPASSVTPDLRARIQAQKSRLIEFLSQAADGQPIPSGEPSAQDRDLYATWDRVIGYAEITIPEAILYAQRYPSLRRALEGVAGSGSGIDAQRLRARLLALAGVLVDDHQFVQNPSNPELWRWASAWSIERAKQVAGRGEQVVRA